MKKIFLFKAALLIIAGFAITFAATAQVAYSTKIIDIQLNGTSNLHDWQMKATSGTAEASFNINGGKLITVSKMDFSLPVKNLKSGHDGMDKNTYKALNAAANPNISFVLTAATVVATGGNNYKLTCAGLMTIAGTSKKVALIADGTYNPLDKSFTVTGVKKMKMTEYNVKPPKALMGTIKTGDDISISYNLKFKI